MRVWHQELSTLKIFALEKDEKVLTWGGFLEHLKLDKFRRLLDQIFLSTEKEYFWQPIPLVKLEQPFYMIMLYTNQYVGKTADYSKLVSSITEKWINITPNSKNNGFLLIPTPVTELADGRVESFIPTSPILSRSYLNYLSLKDFIQHAPIEQKDAFYFSLYNTAYEHLIAGFPVWINTHHLDVPWFILRFDQYPEYSGLPFQNELGMGMANDLTGWLNFAKKYLTHLDWSV